MKQPVSRVSVGLAATCLALAASTVFLALDRNRLLSRSFVSSRILADEAIHEEAVQRLVSQGTGIWDSHADPDVGRVLQPGIDREAFGGIPVRSNRFGMREKEYEVPKPAGMVRVVLLGDSFVFGQGAREEDRCGVVLERELRARSRGFEGAIEVLHLGIGSWNIVTETAYLRRELSLIQPDLVFHITVGNDLDDNQGVRGFGARSRFAPRRRERADGFVMNNWPALNLGSTEKNVLHYALDYESEQRWEEARLEVERLARRVEQQGGRYVMMLNWSWDSNVAQEQLCGNLREDQLAYIPKEFAADIKYKLGENDGHWNAAGMEVVARTMYGYIRAYDLLPTLNLEEWKEADEALVEIHEKGKAYARTAPRSTQWEWNPAWRFDQEVDFERLDPIDDAPHVYGGIMPGGMVSPYGSLTIRDDGRSTLHVRGRCLDRPEMDGATVTVHVDEFEVGTISILAGSEIDFVVALPPETAGRTLVNVRFEADDYVHTGNDLQQCVAFQLSSVRLEP